MHNKEVDYVRYQISVFELRREPARLVTLTDSVSRLPAGRKNPMIGSIMSLTNAVTRLDAA